MNMVGALHIYYMLFVIMCQLNKKYNIQYIEQNQYIVYNIF